MKKKIILIALLGGILSIIIYFFTQNSEITIVSLGDGISLGMTPYDIEGISFNDYLKEYYEEKHELKNYIHEFSNAGKTIKELIYEIKENKSLTIKNEKIEIKQAINQADILTIAIGMDELANTNITSKTKNEYLHDLEELLSMISMLNQNKVIIISLYSWGKNDLLTIEQINSVSFDSSNNYYKDNNALFVLELDDVSEEENEKIVSLIKEKISNYEYYIYMANVDETVAGMDIILLIAVIIIVIVLLLTTKSYFQIVLAFLVFGISILLNMGSNFIFKEISYITNSIAIILQLGLSLDYFIIFMNHYMKEKNDTNDLILAVKKTVTKSALEISSSSLTTIAGLLALVFMQLKIGADIGLVLAKGIVSSLLTVICLLPFLVIFFNKIITKTEHKTRELNISKLANWIVRSRKIILPIFLILVIGSCILVPSYKVENKMTKFRHNENRQ